MKRLRHRLEYWGVSATRLLARVLPWRAVCGLGTILGSLFYAVDARHRRVALANVAAAFPGKVSGERRRIVRRVFGHFGRLLFELLKFSGLEPAEILRRVEIDGAEHVSEALRKRRGVLYFTGHFGYWEIHAIAHGARFDPIGVLARPLDNPHLHRLLEQMRGRTGNHVIYRRGALRRVLRVLGSNQGVALLIDQHIQAPDAVTVSFFDRPAATTLALAILALRTGAPVVPVFALPLGPGRYRLVYEHPVDPPRDESPEAIHDFTQRCTDVLEMYVRRHPAFWLWMHRRWRDDALPNGDGRGMFPAAVRENGPDES
ncbi:MAG: lysophospholipid acyltransferase family protein [Acidobacteriota bacterium]